MTLIAPVLYSVCFMDYRRIYKQLCDRGQIRGREPEVFYEVHHIQPRSFGGRKVKGNLTTLTLREHYIAHLLLTAIYPDSPAMHRALWNMANITPKNNVGYERYKPCARTFERIRGDYMRLCSGKNSPMYGKHHTEETRKKLSDSKMGKVYRTGYNHTEETKDKLRKKAQNRVASEYSLMRNRQANRGGKCYKAKKIVCTETGQEFGSGRELSEYLEVGFSNIRRWLNGGSPAPIWFHYKRVDEDKRVFAIQVDKYTPVFLEDIRKDLDNKVDKRIICKQFSISHNYLTKVTEKHFPEYITKRVRRAHNY